MSIMRAKMKINHISASEAVEVLSMAAVCKQDGYDETGTDENNTFARWTPQADLKITICNPELLKKFSVGEELYLDFTKVTLEK